jgi:serine/threonine-protein phosphatase Stp1
MRFECASRSHVGLKRKINEDSILAETDRGFWVVADGMGGHDAGEVASAMVVDALRALPAAEDLDQLTAQAVEALRGVNRALIDLARSEDRERTIGTTVVGVAIAGGWFSCFWAGDSRAYRMRDGMLARISRDHSLVQQLVDSGMLSADEAEGHENANVITRAVGVAADIVIDTVGGDALQGDRFLLASDGLTRVVDDDEIAAELARSDPERAADALIETVLGRGAPDNVSLIIVRVA